MDVSSFDKVVDRPLAEVDREVRSALAEAGFGVLTEIDVAATLREKLGVDRPPLRILGACNPSLADQALRLDPASALVLPCNVVLRARGDGATEVSITDPRTLMDAPAFQELAADAASRLQSALERL
jgi:uncharacterized protein (DUF302 family)